jgi:copper transport protein
MSRSKLAAIVSSITIFAALIILQSAVSPVYGHALPATYSIEPNSIIKKESIPSQLTMSFSERPDPKISYVHVLNAKNERVDNNDFTITAANGRQATVTLDKAKLAGDGVYSVSWRTMSLDDGHIAEGGYVFGVGNVSPDNVGGQQSQTTTTFVTSTFDALLRWPVIVSQAAIVGGIIAHVVLQRGGSRTGLAMPSKRFALILIASAAAIAACATALIFLQASNLIADTGNNSQYTATVQSLISDSPTGVIWIMRIATSAAIALLAAGYYYMLEKKGAQRNSFAVLLAVLAAGAASIFSNSMLSHNSAATFLPSVAVFADWLHFMAVSTWVGGLFYFSAVLMLAINENAGRSAHMLALVLPRFSLLAIASLGIIGVTGIYMAWIHLHTLDSLFYTQYGNNLIIKLSAALPMVLLGAYHQVKLHKSIFLMASMGARKGSSSEVVANHGNAVAKFGRTVKIESLVGIGVLFAASLLTITSPPSHMHQSGAPGMSDNSYSQRVTINGVDTTLGISPFHAGFNTFTVTLREAGQAPQNINAVFLRFTNVNAGIGPIVATLDKAGDGIYSSTGGFLSQSGDWKIDVVVQRINAYDLNHSFYATIAAGHDMSMDMEGMMEEDSASTVNNQEAEPAPAFDSFAWLAIGLAAAVAAGSAYYFKKSRLQLRQTVELLEKS